MLNIFSKILDANQRTVNTLAETVKKINDLESKTKKLSDKGLKDKTLDLKKRYLKNSNLDELLPEAFALVREASLRVNKQRPYDVQLIASVALHQGKIAEQRTGEGKTLTAAPALFLNALTDQGVHCVTVNDYLARRDCGWNGPIFHALGLSCATIIHDQAFVYDPKFSNKEAHDSRLKHLRPVSRKEAYAADITYGTNNEFGFDYLRDNMALSLDQQAQRGHFFAIVDEVDSILIDEARTPLIISRPAQEPTEKYLKFGKIIKTLQADTDYVIDEKLRTAHLTEHGTIKIEKLLGVDNLYEKDFASLHHLEEALKANTLFLKDRDYVVKDDEVIIVDEFTGRLMPGRRYSEGLHQAIEAKEGVRIQQESETLATISFQNYFRMYKKLSGMTGTAVTEAEEFHKIYKLEVLVIPTNQPMIRDDRADAIYKTQTAKYNAVAEEIALVHKTGQPILVGTTSIEKNEFLSELLKRKGISHALLNAKNHEGEAEIISKAGEKGAVTVATNLAGRGVDIKLGSGVDKLGGLYVLGTERHESRRIDNQLRGRSGRQGDPGVSKFFVSLEDDLMRIFGGEQVAKVMNFLKMPEDMPIEHAMVSRAIEGAQKKVEGHNFDIRKHTVEYDDVMNQQRQIIYGVRKQILEVAAGKKSDEKTARQSDLSLKEEILGKTQAEISNVVSVYAEDEIEREKIVDEFSTIVPFDGNSKKALVKQLEEFNSQEKVSEFLSNLSVELYDAREKQIGPEVARSLETFVYLSTIDTLWIEHLDTVDDLRAGIGLRGYAQRDPLVEYKKEAFDLFERLMANVDADIVHKIYKVPVQGQQPIAVGSSQPVINLDRVVEDHQEALDERELREEIGQLMPELPEISKDTKVKVEGSSNDEAYSSHEGHNHPELVSGSSNGGSNDGTKVTVERGGQVIAQETYGAQGQLQKAHGKIGRNDPCWCGSGKKYKKCHFPN